MTNTFTISAAEGYGGLIITLEELLTELGLSTSSATATERAVAYAALKRANGAVIRHLRYNPMMSVRTEYYPQQDLALQSGNGVWEANDDSAYFRRTATAATTELQVQGLPVRQKDMYGLNSIDLRIDYDGRSGTRSGSFGSDTLKTEGVDFHPNYTQMDSYGNKVCLDGIIRSEGLWPDVAGSVKLIYVAGYTTDELAGTDDKLDASPIKEAVIDESVRRVHKAFSRMKKRTGFGVGALSSESLGDYSYSADGASLKELTGSGSDLLAETAMKLESFVNFGILLL